MITVLTGGNSYALQADLKRRIAAFWSEHGEFGLEKLDGDDVSFERISESVQSMPFLSGKKMVVLRSPSSQKIFQEQFESLLPTVPDETDVLIVEPKLDKRTVYYKALKKLTDFHEFAELDEQQLKSWLVSSAKQKGATLNPNDARYLIERVGPNQEHLGNELEKLFNYDANITRAHIDLLTELTPQSTIFELLDAAFAGNHAYALKLYHQQRALKVEPLNILAMITWQLHILAIVKTAGERTADEIARAARLNPYVVRKTQDLARHISFDSLKQIVHETLELDVSLKTVSIDADEALQNLLLNLDPEEPAHTYASSLSIGTTSPELS